MDYYLIDPELDTRVLHIPEDETGRRALCGFTSEWVTSLLDNETVFCEECDGLDVTNDTPK